MNSQFCCLWQRSTTPSITDTGYATFMNIRHLLPIALLLLSACGLSTKMYKEDYRDVLLCNEIHGQLLDHGKPLVGVAVQRSVGWSLERESRIDIAITDSQGRYAFPEVRGSGQVNFFTNFVPYLGSVHRIRIFYYGTTHFIYTASLDGVTEPLKYPIQFTSDLANREVNTPNTFWIEPKFLSNPNQ